MAVHVVGPVWNKNKWVFLCPECDADVIDGLDSSVARQCTTEWLQGQELRYAPSFGDRSCLCWETDPYEGQEEATDKERRFFYYRAVAAELGAQGRRVDLPGCVKDKIQELYGESTTGFQA